MKKELTPSEVLFNINLSEGDGDLKLKDIPKIKSAYKKIERAIKIKEEGYNLYLIDSFSKERLNELITFIKELYKDCKEPKDICYGTINDARKPRAIFLSNGKGKELKEEVDNIKNSYFEVAMEFYNTSSESEKDSIIEEIHTKRNGYIGELVDIAKKEGFDVKATTGGFAFIPLKEGEAMTEKEYDDLPKDAKGVIIEKAAELKKRAEVVLDNLKNIEVTSLKKLKEIYREFLNIELEPEKEACLVNFIDDDDAYEYLEELFFNIEDQLVECYSINVEDDEKAINEILNKFDLAVLVDNSNYKTPRVIYEEDPSVENLIGTVEYENHNGSYKSELSLITPGSLILANEGCVIIRLSQLISNSYSYYYLKKSLVTGKVNINTSKSYLDLLSINGLKPEAIPFKAKIIIIGDYESYDILYDADEDFRKLFPLRVEISRFIDYNEIQGKALKNYILERCKKYNLNNVNDDAIKEVIKYLCRLSNHKNKLNLDNSNIDKMLLLASNGIDARGMMGEDIVKVAYEEELIENEIMSMYKDKKIIITVKGRKIGTINALAVLNSGYYSFGKPMRVTCTVSIGDGKIVDIQKESNLSGSIHEKSINILSGLISNLINPYEKLPVNFHLSFEQTYGTIDGDSASVSELLCMLSALSKKGIRQNIAVTGSINQFGEIQAIGGVNDKIEGFYNTCNLLGDSKNKGVLIPTSNKNEIILKKEVEDAIEKGDFHIYTMDTLEDAIEVMILDENETISDFYDAIAEEIIKYKPNVNKKN